MISPRFKFVEDKIEGDYGKFVLEPLEPGFGQTVAVAIRRVLLSSIEGAAITTVSINGVQHMFSKIPGLKEDVVEFILNIKGVHVKLLDSASSARIFLRKNGPGQIKASDIETSEGVEIVNLDHYLGSLSDKKSKIEVEMTVEKGMGYTLAEERRISTIGVIPIDAVFSPVLKVSYRVDSTRVGRQTNFDKLTMELWTDGTVDAREAFIQASKILVSYFSQVYEPKVDSESSEVSPSDNAVPEDLLKMTVDELDLPTRIYNSLRNAGIESVGQLLSTPRKELMGLRNLGAKSLSIIESSLEAKGIPFSSY